jgi:hypothetical protein
MHAKGISRHKHIHALSLSSSLSLSLSLLHNASHPTGFFDSEWDEVDVSGCELPVGTLSSVGKDVPGLTAINLRNCSGLELLRWVPYRTDLPFKLSDLDMTDCMPDSYARARFRALVYAYMCAHGLASLQACALRYLERVEGHVHVHVHPGYVSHEPLCIVSIASSPHMGRLVQTCTYMLVYMRHLVLCILRHACIIHTRTLICMHVQYTRVHSSVHFLRYVHAFTCMYLGTHVRNIDIHKTFLLYARDVGRYESQT